MLNLEKAEERIITVYKMADAIRIETKQSMAMLADHSNETCPLPLVMGEQVKAPISIFGIDEDMAEILLKFQGQIDKTKPTRLIDAVFKILILALISLMRGLFIRRVLETKVSLSTCKCPIVALTSLHVEKVVDGKVKKIGVVRNIERKGKSLTLNVTPEFFGKTDHYFIQGDNYLRMLEIVALGIFNTTDVMVDSTEYDGIQPYNLYSVLHLIELVSY